jgi:hypothetical protein
MPEFSLDEKPCNSLGRKHYFEMAQLMQLTPQSSL